MFLIFLALFTTTIAVDQSVHNNKLVAAHIELANQNQALVEANNDINGVNKRLKSENKDLVRVVQSVTSEADKKFNKTPCFHVTPCKLKDQQ